MTKKTTQTVTPIFFFNLEENKVIEVIFFKRQQQQQKYCQFTCVGIREVTEVMDGKIKYNLFSPSLGFDFCTEKKKGFRICPRQPCTPFMY